MSSSNPDVIRIEACLAEALETEKWASARVKQLKEALETAKLAESTAKETDASSQLESRLEGLNWTPAKSGRCDFCRDSPSELVTAVRAAKEIKGSVHTFTAAKDTPTLFRFKRGAKA